MSKVTKRKHVMNEALWDDYELPNDNQSVVKILKSRGNNLHEVSTPSGEEYLVSMPTKFRKNIWVKRGDYVLVEPIPEGDKVKAEIVKIMNKNSVKFYKQNGVWPVQFEEKKIICESFDSTRPESEESDDDSDLVENCNRKSVTNFFSETSETSDSSYETSDEEDESIKK